MIVVTAPTGNIGRCVVQGLLDAGKKIRVIVRDPARLPPRVRDLVEIVQGTHADAHVVDRAFSGASAVFWLVPPDPRRTIDEAYVEFTRPAAEAVRRHSIQRVVGVTALGRGTEWQYKAGLVSASLRMDDLLMATGVAYRALAMPSFMDNALQQTESISAEGAIYGPLDPDMKAPATATRDMGVVAAQLLTDSSWTDQKTVSVLGPDYLSMVDMANIMSEILAREVRYHQITFEAFRARLANAGMSGSFLDGYVDMMRAKNEGMDNASFQGVTVRTPTSFRQWCEEELKPAIQE